MGDDYTTGRLMSDAQPSDCISIFREVMASTKRRPQRQQSRQLREANGFALSPIRAVFLDSNRWVVEQAAKLLVMRFFTFVPTLPLTKGTPSSTREVYRQHEGFFAALDAGADLKKDIANPLHICRRSTTALRICRYR